MKRGFLKTFEIIFLEKTFKIWMGVIHGRGQYTSKYGTVLADKEQVCAVSFRTLLNAYSNTFNKTIDSEAQVKL
jgi:hypothetical protein